MSLDLDILLRGGHVIDPAAKRDATADVGIRDGKVVAVEDRLPDAGAAVSSTCPAKSSSPA